MDSNLKLKRLYNRFNRLYWNGELPDVAIWWEPCQGAIGCTFEIDGADFLGIKLDPCLMGMKRTSHWVLIHEMAHVYLWPRGYKLKDHGDAFDEEIKRLCTFKSYRKLL